LIDSPTNTDSFFDLGWRRFRFDPQIYNWIEKSIGVARDRLCDPSNADWFRYQNTWFAGVNVLGNDRHGAVPNGPPLGGEAIDYIAHTLGLRDIEWDSAQLSVVFPGYPKPATSEPAAAHRYRLLRDAAHVDGIQRLGSARRRFLGETHAFILGVPMLKTAPQAAPLVVWERSHEIVRQTLKDVYSGSAVEHWPTIDITEIYQAMRRRIFDSCKRVEIWMPPGETYLVHRLALHGMAGWPAESDQAGAARMICYFRPSAITTHDWLFTP